MSLDYYFPSKFKGESMGFMPVQDGIGVFSGHASLDPNARQMRWTKGGTG